MAVFKNCVVCVVCGGKFRARCKSALTCSIGCRKVYRNDVSKSWYAANWQRAKDNRIKWLRENRDRYHEISYAIRERTREECKERARKWRMNNSEQCLKQSVRGIAARKLLKLIETGNHEAILQLANPQGATL